MKLSRRERQIMDILYQKGSATAAEVLELIQNPPSYSAIRAKLRIMEEKGYVSHVQDGPRYIYRPIVERKSAEKTAMAHMLDTFYDNSVEKAMAALFEMHSSKLSDSDLDRLERLIEKTRGKKS